MNTSAFLFDDVCVSPDRQIGSHSHPRWELSYIIRGGGVRTVGDKTEPMAEGEIVLIPPGIRHEWRFDPDVTDADGNIRNISVTFSPSVIDGMIELYPEIADSLMSVRSLSEAISYSGASYGNIKALLLSMRGLSAAERLPLMIKLLTAIADVSGGKGVGRGDSLGRIGRRCEKIRVYCACNYARHISLDEMARHVGMNKSAFCTFMRNRFGVTFSNYLNNFRLELAKEKLRLADRNVSEVAIDCGFANVTYFNRLFKARFGYTPRQFLHSGAPSGKD